MKYHLIPQLLLLSLSCAFAQISIEPSREISNYIKSPKDTTVVDLDLDGDLDIIVHEEFLGWVKWYLNDGLGNFSIGGEWAPDINRDLEYWDHLGFMDYDEDGYLDLLGILEVNKTQSLCLVRGIEGAIFEKDFIKILDRDYDDDYGLDPLNIALQDFDGDGRMDILFEKHIILLSETPLEALETNASLDDFNNWDEDLPLIDWNNDGMLDLIDIRGEPQLIIRLNEGHGQFSEEQTIALFPPEQEEDLFDDIHIYPINRAETEGLLELCLISEIDNIEYASIITKDTHDSVSVSAAKPLKDLLPPEYSGTITYGIQDERVIVIAYKLGIQEVAAYQLSWNGTLLSAQSIITNVPSYFITMDSLKIGNLDMGDTADLIITVNQSSLTGSSQDEIFWLKDSIGAPYHSARNSIVDPSYEQTLHASLDFNLDGNSDLITLQKRPLGSPSGNLVLWLTANDGGAFQQLTLPGENTISSVLQTIELDESFSQLGNEFAEADSLLGGTGLLLSRNISPNSEDENFVSAISYLYQEADGNFALLDYQQFENYSLGESYLEDLNGDGIDDLLCALNLPYTFSPNSDDKIQIRFGSSDTIGFEDTFLTLDNLTLIAPPFDLDLDGDLDLSVSELDPLTNLRTDFWIENKNGEFSDRRERAEILNPYNPNRNTPITRLDLDGDGDLDQIGAKHTSRILGWSRVGWFENKEGAEQVDAEQNQLESFTRARWAGRDSHLLVDLDNDGVKDLVVASSFHARLEWFKITHGSQPQNYANWAAAQGVTGHSSAPEADWDGDFVTNWQEYAFGSNPNQADRTHPGFPQISTTASGAALKFHKRRGNDITYQYLESPDLKSWSIWEPEEANLSPIDENYESVLVPLPLPRAFFIIEPMLPEEGP